VAEQRMVRKPTIPPIGAFSAIVVIAILVVVIHLELPMSAPPLRQVLHSEDYEID
jgi:hypothetical protein